jgi:hypothetical protein
MPNEEQNNNEIKALEKKQIAELEKSMDLIDTVCLKKYLNDLDSRYNVVPFQPISNTVSVYEITEIVYERGIFVPDKLSMLYSALHSSVKSIFILINKGRAGTHFYLGAVDKEKSTTVDNSDGFTSNKLLKDSLSGYFPGMKIKDPITFKLGDAPHAAQLPVLFNGMVNPARGEVMPISKDYHSEVNKQLAVLENNVVRKNLNLATVSSVASLIDDKKQGFIQGIENFIEGCKEGGDYTAVILADSITKEQLQIARAGYEELYTQLSPLAERNITYSESDSHGENTFFSENQSESISHSISKTTSNSSGDAASVNLGFSYGGVSLGGSISSFDTTGEANTNTDSTTIVKGTTRGSGTSQMYTIGQNYVVKIENKTVKEYLNRIDRQLKRIELSESLGLWNCAAYFLSNTNESVLRMANLYKGQINGTNSGVETSAINVWNQQSANENFQKMLQYVFHFSHPVFCYQPEGMKQIYSLTAANLVNSSELAVQMSLPMNSVQGVQVSNHASFGREVRNALKGDAIRLGKVYNLGREEKTVVELNVDSLTSHTFITGNVGRGKSNTVFHILESLHDKGIPFLAIEPTKGEYKQHFYGIANVLGTENDEAELLKINPFSFPDKIKVNNHIDYLVGILCACWPMYAGMPQALETSISQAYVSCGWNLNRSYNPYGLFPTMKDVVAALRNYINNTNFSQDTRGDYEGALTTRLDAFSNGVLSNVISYQEETSYDELFNQSTIVDLSSVKSSETLSLVMALLVMKLDEYRSKQYGGTYNQPLHHVTVLEEAHHLLKRTSTEQSAESSNVVGKSVDLLSNAIREMRTYGEGFIISDQSPEKLDSAAISVTNTKIIMQLPNYKDCAISGKSVSLSDEQIEEISKLKTGVAIVKQGEWESAVMCKIDKAKEVEGKYEYQQPPYINRPDFYQILVSAYKNRQNIKFADFKETVKKADILSLQKRIVLKRFGADFSADVDSQTLCSIIYDLFGDRPKFVCHSFATNPDNYVGKLIRELSTANEELFRAFDKSLDAVYAYAAGGMFTDKYQQLINDYNG